MDSLDIIHHARKGYQYRKTLWDAGSILPLSFNVCVRMRVRAECVWTCMCVRRVHVCAVCWYKSMETRPEPDGFGQIFRNDAGVGVGSVTSGRKGVRVGVGAALELRFISLCWGHSCWFEFHIRPTEPQNLWCHFVEFIVIVVLFVSILNWLWFCATASSC